ncbi:MAG: iron ABC transporter permease [Dehalococcoidia bacterium]|nr:iron ABC transporter permease [Dehalococcoidia bacterium]
MPPVVTIVAAGGLLLVAMGVAVALGSVRLGPGQVFDGLFDRGDPVARQIVWQLRVPRVLVAALVGANLGLAGVLLQGITRNPLADPHILGFSAGAGLAAIAVLVIAPGTPVQLVAPAAFLGSLASAAVVYALAWRGGISPVRFALSGVAVAALFTALSTAVIATSDLFTQATLSFLAGGLFGRDWSHFKQLWPYTVGAGSLTLLAAGWLNILALGDDMARGLGLRVERARLLLAVLAAVLTGSAVAVSGLLAFIGLVVPHAARLVAGNDYRVVMPLAAILGAALLVVADTFARVALAPTELPVGIVTAVVGAPAFLLLVRTRT